jgi:hypothetical protein
VKKPPISGPITEATPNTAPKMPWYFPRSRGGTTSPIAAVVGDDQPAAAEPLQGAEGHQLGQVLGDPTQRRADQEQHQRDLEHDLASVEIAELAVDRGDRGLGEQVGGDHPGDVAEAAEVTDDRRQRGGDDRLVQRRHQHHQHQAAEDDADAARRRDRGLARTLAGAGGDGAHAASPSA